MKPAGTEQKGDGGFTADCEPEQNSDNRYEHGENRVLAPQKGHRAGLDLLRDVPHDLVARRLFADVEVGPQRKGQTNQAERGSPPCGINQPIIHGVFSGCVWIPFRLKGHGKQHRLPSDSKKSL
jgi:hypothetical protein